MNTLEITDLNNTWWDVNANKQHLEVGDSNNGAFTVKVLQIVSLHRGKGKPIADVNCSTSSSFRLAIMSADRVSWNTYERRANAVTQPGFSDTDNSGCHDRENRFQLIKFRKKRSRINKGNARIWQGTC